MATPERYRVMKSFLTSIMSLGVVLLTTLVLLNTGCSHLETNTKFMNANQEWAARRAVVAALKDATRGRSSCGTVNVDAPLPMVYYGDGHLLAKKCPLRNGTVVYGCYHRATGTKWAEIYILETMQEPFDTLWHEYKHHYIITSNLSYSCLQELAIE